MWSIPEQRVVDWADVHEMVTAAAFAPDGRRACVGTMKGRCRFYVCEPSFKLEYQAQIGAHESARLPLLMSCCTPPGCACCDGRSRRASMCRWVAGQRGLSHLYCVTVRRAGDGAPALMAGPVLLD